MCAPLQSKYIKTQFSEAGLNKFLTTAYTASNTNHMTTSHITSLHEHFVGPNLKKSTVSVQKRDEHLNFPKNSKLR